MRELLRALKFHWAHHKRDLPWRRTRDPYKILVSEIMLQQTQVERVLPFYAEFTKRFPTAQTLARAPLSQVLAAWQGLGYNRRARYLQEAAKIIAREGFTSRRLPGVGPYTMAAVSAFAFNKPEICIETNIRTVFLHHLYSNILQNDVTRKVSDTEILPLVAEALKKSRMQPRDFYAALMDYGSYLKQNGVKLNVRSKHYVKQSAFEGSRRQRRAASLRAALTAGASEKKLLKILHS